MTRAHPPSGNQLYFICLFVLLIFTGTPLTLHGEEVFLDEQFNSIERWQPFYFKNIKTHSSYKPTTLGTTSCLQATSSNSASALILPERFNIYNFPDISWRWQISNVYQKGDCSRKEGDDAPIRLYVMFQYDPDKASFFKKIQFETIKLLYGEYPPHSSLNYIWSSKTFAVPFMPNPYSNLAMMIPVDSGQENIGKWREHTANIVEDYRAAFREDPPPIAGIAIMNDSDNTGESATAYVDYIRIYKKSPAP